MGRKKGISNKPNKCWPKEEKLRIINEAYKIGIRPEAYKENISSGMISTWMKKYEDYGEKGLENKTKPGNPLSKYSNKKELSKEEQLEYEVMKLRIENERLKKGYQVKGDGPKKQFIFLKNKNLK